MNSQKAMDVVMDKKNVLFVDDEARILRTLKALFRRDYNVHLANSGAEAIEILKEIQFDIVVSDQRMPNMLGHELLSHVKRMQPQAIRLLLTGYVDKAAIINTINDGEIFRFLSKPWQINEMIKTISEAATLSETSFIDNQEAANDDSNTLGLDRLNNLKGSMPAVLMMSDDQHIRNQIRATSRDSGFEIYSASSLKEAIDIIKLRDQIGVTVFSVDSNPNDTLSALTMLRSIKPEMSTIVLSSMTDSNVAISLINESKVFRYLETPLDSNELEKSLVDGIIRHDQLKVNTDAQKRYKSDSSKLNLSASLKKIFSIFGG